MKNSSETSYHFLLWDIFNKISCFVASVKIYQFCIDQFSLNRSLFILFCFEIYSFFSFSISSTFFVFEKFRTSISLLDKFMTFESPIVEEMRKLKIRFSQLFSLNRFENSAWFYFKDFSLIKEENTSMFFVSNDFLLLCIEKNCFEKIWIF